MEPDLNTRVRLRGDRVSWKRTGEEVIALELEGHEYLAACQTGAELWELLAEPITGEDLAAWLADHYDVQADEARHDVSAFLQQLFERGLLEIV